MKALEGKEETASAKQTVADMMRAAGSTASTSGRVYTGLTRERSKEVLSDFIAASDSPFAVVENPYFIRMLREYAQFDAWVPTAKTVKTDMEEKYLRMKAEMRELLRKVPSVSLCVDSWTTPN